MRLLATVTLKPNQLRAYVTPLLMMREVQEVVLVTDELPPDLPKLRGIVPHPLVRRALGRTASKLLTCVHVGRRLRPEWVVSYSLVPHAVTAWLTARLVGSRTMYHMIGGPIEWEGGGWNGDNRLLRRLPRPSPLLERLLLSIVRRQTLVCTMGGRARQSLLARGFPPRGVVVTPASIDTRRFHPRRAGAPRTYDLLTVADLIPLKRVHDFLVIVRRLRDQRLDVRAAVAGDGPLARELREAAWTLGVADAVDFLGVRMDIESVYRDARIFVLTSRTEGLSVAMSEAMASGLPVVVSDVGDLPDLVQHGENGYLAPVGDVDAFVGYIGLLLSDTDRYARASAAARDAVIRHCGVDRLIDLYRRLLLAAEPADEVAT